MKKASSFISVLTLLAFVQSHVVGLWASPVATREPVPPAIVPEIARVLIPPSETLCLGRDSYSQATLRLQYDTEDKTLEWQLLNSGYVLSSQSHALPEDTLVVDNGLVFNGDQIVVAGRTTNEHWFIRALNSQGEFQWQRKGEGRINDLAFSDDGQTLYGVGSTIPLPDLGSVLK